MKYRPELTDEQIRELTFLQLAHRVSGRPMKELVKSATLPLEVLALGKPKKKDEAETAEAGDAKAKAADKPAAGKPARKRAR
jgi:hypothetical protein